MSDDKTTADIHLIRRILPHRYPYLMVDRVEEIDGIDTACGIKNVSMNEPHFQGHFPAYPIMPGVAIVESMAQTAAVMVGTTLDMADKNMLVYFMAIDRCKFRRMVGPGDVLRLRVKRLRGAAGGKVWKFEGRAEVEGELACEAEFTAKMEMTGL